MNASDMLEHSRMALEKSHAQDKFYRVNPPKHMGKRTSSISSLQNLQTQMQQNSSELYFTQGPKNRQGDTSRNKRMLNVKSIKSI